MTENMGDCATCKHMNDFFCEVREEEILYCIDCDYWEKKVIE